MTKFAQAWFGLWQEFVKDETVDGLKLWMVGSHRSLQRVGRKRYGKE